MHNIRWYLVIILVVHLTIKQLLSFPDMLAKHSEYRLLVGVAAQKGTSYSAPGLNNDGPYR